MQVAKNVIHTVMCGFLLFVVLCASEVTTIWHYTNVYIIIIIIIFFLTPVLSSQGMKKLSYAKKNQDYYYNPSTLHTNRHMSCL